MSVAESSALADFFDCTVQLTRTAVAECGDLVQQLSLACQSTELRYTGAAALTPVMSPMAHLLSTGTPECGFKIDLIDGKSANLQLPTPPWFAGDQLLRGEIVGLEHPTIKLLVDTTAGICTLYDHSQRRLLRWINDASRLPAYERAAPLRAAINWWLANDSTQLVHAAALGTTAGGLMIAGAGGSGKSTTAVAGALAGCGYVGDDYIAVNLSDGLATAYALYGSAKLHPRSLERLGMSALVAPLGSDRQSGEEKTSFLLSDEPGVVLTPFVPLKALIVPTVTGQDRSRVIPLGKLQALLALAPTTLFQLQGASPDALSFMKEIVATLPCFGLELGPDPYEVIAVLRQFAENELELAL